MKPIFLITLISSVVCACNSGQSQSNQSPGNHATDTLKKKIVQSDVLSTVNYNQVFENTIVDEMPIKLLEIGNLKVPTGRIVACDPLVTVNFTSFNKTVKPGIYPVKIYVAQTKQSGERYAIAKIGV